ncbi:phage portal protein [Sulfitobacter dubius]|uniref:phage portal protein n=1 Tax=Sulfitobacter dubius TaxID=218673 RepID=UPI0030D9AA70
MSPTHTRPESLPVRILRALSVVTVDPPQQEAAFVAGSDFASAEAVQTAYDPRRAASALLANPWYWRAVGIRAASLAALPLQVQRRTAEGFEPVDDHPLAQLLQRPNSQQTARQFRTQLVTDLLPSGNGYILPIGIGAPGTAPAALLLLEPARVTITPGQDGAPLAYVYDTQGAVKSYPPDVVGHARFSAAGGGLQRLYGTGEVQPMDRDLAADVAMAAQMARKSSRGRPDAAYVPQDSKTTWGRPQVRDMQTQIDRILQEQTGGVAVMSGAGKFEAIDWTIGDLGGIDMRAWARSVVVAVTGVPPTLLGLQSANYATAEMERRSFISDTLTPLAALLDDALTDLARRLGFADVRIRHVLPEMQDGRTDRLQRVALHIAHGMSPADAYRFEGFDDAPDVADFGIDPATSGAPQDAPRVDDEARDDVRAQAAAVAEMLTDQQPDDEDDILTEVGALLDLLGPLLDDQ